MMMSCCSVLQCVAMCCSVQDTSLCACLSVSFYWFFSSIHTHTHTHAHTHALSLTHKHTHTHTSPTNHLSLSRAPSLALSFFRSLNPPPPFLYQLNSHRNQCQNLIGIELPFSSSRFFAAEYAQVNAKILKSRSAQCLTIAAGFPTTHGERE